MLHAQTIKLVDGSATAHTGARRGSSATPHVESTPSGMLDNLLALISVALILATAVFVVHAYIGS